MTGDRPAPRDQPKVLLAQLVECTSGRGNCYLRGWLGASNLVAFRGDPDDQGGPTWRLYLTERQARADDTAGTGERVDNRS